jgi:hypothetical protein
VTATAHGVHFRRYVRLAAAAFLLITAYSVTSKLVKDRLAHDWVHSLLHALSAAAAMHAGWLARSLQPARLVTLMIGVGYTLLGVVGWFTPGFLLHSVVAVPLDAAANVFHLLLGVPALVLVVHDARRTPQAP